MLTEQRAIPRQRGPVTAWPPAAPRVRWRDRPVVQLVALIVAEVVRAGAMACGAVVGAGVGVMVLDWLT